MHDPSFTQYRTLPELFPAGSTCFMLGQPNYGCRGQVLQVSPEHRGRVQLSFTEAPEPDLRPVVRAKNDLSVKYLPGFRIAQSLGVSSHVLSRVTGSIFINKSPRETDADRQARVNVGLNLKFNKKNEEVCGYTRRGSDNGWLYSEKVGDTIGAYMEAFPEVFDYLARSNSNASKDVFHVDDVFGPGEDGAGLAQGSLDKLAALAKWIKELPSSNSPRQPCGTQTLDEEVVKALEKCVDSSVAEAGGGKKTVVTMQVGRKAKSTVDLISLHLITPRHYLPF